MDIDLKLFKKITNPQAMIKLGEKNLIKYIKNEFLNIVMTKSFQFALDKIAEAFQKRAEELFNKA